MYHRYHRNVNLSQNLMRFGLILLFAYFVGLSAGRWSYTLCSQTQKYTLNLQASAFIASPAGQLAQGIRPALGSFLWMVILGVVPFGFIGCPAISFLRGVAAGQLLSAIAGLGVKGVVWVVLVILPIECFWMVPVLWQGVKSMSFSSSLLPRSHESWYNHTWWQQRAVHYLGQSAVMGLLLLAAWLISWGYFKAASAIFT